MAGGVRLVARLGRRRQAALETHDHAAVAQGGRGFLRGIAVLLCVVQDASQADADAFLGVVDGGPYPEEFGRGVILYLAEFVEDAVNARHDVGKYGNVFCQFVEGRICGGLFFVAGVEEPHDMADGGERCLQGMEFPLVHVAAFSLYAHQAAAHVQEVLLGEIVFLLHDASEFPDLCQQPVDDFRGTVKRNLVGQRSAER